MKQPFISIVINNYNYERYLSTAIDSALAQEYEPFEVIVVDDGSTDDSREIMAVYGDKIRPIYKDNGGQASAFNAGAAHARGDLVAFLDSDDYFFANKLRTIADIFAVEPDYVLYYHGVQRVSADGASIEDASTTLQLSGNVEKLFRESGGWLPFPPTSGLVFHRKFIDAVFPMPEDRLGICADAFLHDAAPFEGTIRYVPEVLAAYRIHGSNNWLNPDFLEGRANQRRLERYVIRNESLNAFLDTRGKGRVQLDKCLPYCELRWQSEGRPRSGLLHLIRLGLSFPAYSFRQRAQLLKRLGKSLVV